MTHQHEMLREGWPDRSSLAAVNKGAGPPFPAVKYQRCSSDNNRAAAVLRLPNPAASPSSHSTLMYTGD
jgi:hypothetical protein